MSSPVGPQTAPALATFTHKYCQRGETYRDVCNRVASALSDSDAHYRSTREVLLDQRFVPGGRILSTVGTTKCTTPYNCFVSGAIADSFVDGPGNIMQRAHEAAATLRMGGGIGYDFSTLRPRGDKIAKLDSHSTGPISFMEIFGAIGACTSSTGERRGAQMAILRVDHPDIEEFIHAKQNPNRLTSFNLSIAITDEFMQAVAEGDEFPLRFNGRVYRSVDAAALWNSIMRSTWDWAEPGVVFIDRINHWNNLSYCETIAATNPCSEQPLPPFGACLLGAFNLVRYLKPRAAPASLDSPRWTFDKEQLIADIPLVVRSMDNVVDQAIYPIPGQQISAEQTRRMGLGVMGLANALEACGLPYGTDGFLAEMEVILATIKDHAYLASAALAKEKGPCPAYVPASYLERPFIKALSPIVRAAISEHGIRNSHLTTIAPTGTTSFCMDNVSSGIEPVWAPLSRRIVSTPSGPTEYEVQDYGTAIGVTPRTAMEVSAKEHIAVLALAQRHVDSAISKTCNVPSTMAWDDFKDLYIQAWKQGAKGCSTFQVGGKRAGIMTEACIDGSCAA